MTKVWHITFFNSQPRLFEHNFPYFQSLTHYSCLLTPAFVWTHFFSLSQCTRKRRLYSINIYITYRLQLPLEFPTSSTVSSTPQATERWEFKFVIPGSTYNTNFWLAQANKYGQLVEKKGPLSWTLQPHKTETKNAESSGEHRYSFRKHLTKLCCPIRIKEGFYFNP